MRHRTPLYVLKRRAKALGRKLDIPHLAALDQVAQSQGYRRWSALLREHQAAATGTGIFAQLAPSELLLLGARPQQGKTLKSVEILCDALGRGHRAWFFSLEENRGDLLARIERQGHDTARFGDRLSLDCSDGICADAIIAQLQHAPRGSLFVVDYLQLLDQPRRRPSLQAQVQRLRDFVRSRGLVAVILTQIDRRFELDARRFPTLEDLRLPNPLDTALFDKTCFMHQGEHRLAAVRRGPD